MKRIIVFLIAAFVSYSYFHKAAEQKREKLVGTWSTERSFQGGWVRLILNLKPEGTASVDVDANVQGRARSKGAYGQWTCVGSNLLITFNNSEIPVYQLGKEYGGHILTLEEKTLSYTSEQGTETWTRLR